MTKLLCLTFQAENRAVGQQHSSEKGHCETLGAAYSECSAPAQMSTPVAVCHPAAIWTIGAESQAEQPNSTPERQQHKVWHSMQVMHLSTLLSAVSTYASLDGRGSRQSKACPVIFVILICWPKPDFSSSFLALSPACAMYQRLQTDMNGQLCKGCSPSLSMPTIYFAASLSAVSKGLSAQAKAMTVFKDTESHNWRIGDHTTALYICTIGTHLTDLVAAAQH